MGLAIWLLTVSCRIDSMSRQTAAVVATVIHKHKSQHYNGSYSLGSNHHQHLSWKLNRLSRQRAFTQYLWINTRNVIKTISPHSAEACFSRRSCWHLCHPKTGPLLLVRSNHLILGINFLPPTQLIVYARLGTVVVPPVWLVLSQQATNSLPGNFYIRLSASCLSENDVPPSVDKTRCRSERCRTRAWGGQAQVA